MMLSRTATANFALLAWRSVGISTLTADTGKSSTGKESGTVHEILLKAPTLLHKKRWLTAKYGATLSVFQQHGSALSK